MEKNNNNKDIEVERIEIGWSSGELGYTLRDLSQHFSEAGLSSSQKTQAPWKERNKRR